MADPNSNRLCTNGTGTYNVGAACADDQMTTKKESWLAMMELSNMIAVPMALYAAVRLNVPDAIYNSGHNVPLTAAEILDRLKPAPALACGPGPATDPTNLQRILRLLSCHGVFLEHIDTDVVADGKKSPTTSTTTNRRRYSLTEVGKTLLVPISTTGGTSGGPSYAAYVLQHHQEAILRAWPLLHEFVLDPAGPEPFARAHGGVSAYQYYGSDMAANQLMQKAMDGVSAAFMECFLDGYLGFDSESAVATLVDVGGSSGECLRRIMARWPTITSGINFDLPEVVAIAPVSFPGVTHIGGDMFKFIPRADAVFMKWILTTWTDDQCVAILRNCHAAVPDYGKVVACEPVLPEHTDRSRRTRALLEGDIFVMATYSAGGRERTEAEFRRIGRDAGFPRFRALYLDHFYTILEFLK